MFEFDSDENELILDDDGNEVSLVSLSLDRCNSTETSVDDLCVKRNSLGFFRKKQPQFMCFFW